MDDLVTWLRAQLDDDERMARAAAGGHPIWDTNSDGNVVQLDTGGSGYLAVGPWDGDLFEVGDHIARHDPARVLRQVERDRRILDRCAEAIGGRDLSGYDRFGSLADEPNALALFLAVETMRDLALPYVDRPGYRDEWQPE